MSVRTPSGSNTAYQSLLAGEMVDARDREALRVLKLSHAWISVKEGRSLSRGCVVHRFLQYSFARADLRVRVRHSHHRYQSMVSRFQIQ